ncbi:hypothetical protein SPRG_21399 [Saprolegnia parasitica CBS 223.65]|uniref:Protein kinase domain-containing protein n=1 Tax=Saprolegnia parasitica (strain CBS 223.65) TaxID=695850 RepID=A0A067BS37_SAPPC|nr:hypothetical protein SPRG_21399 [Saprolegnia parasitica CBS 223.65]KDO19610.1 hypothetical protein SPRG_21399 [Saprolegnia parasitica CBS 223.65]|eukprot:XP_012209680.1 hypothetical protein SPRG_21399 [Saprolegnia parasitica CBS 223.65]
MWMLLGLASGVAAASCPYTSLGGSTRVLAGDVYCGGAQWCILSPLNCSILGSYVPLKDTFWSVDAIGDMTNYANPQLTLESENRPDLSQMRLPASLQKLTFRYIRWLPLDRIMASWPALTTLTMTNCSLDALPRSFTYPAGLKSLNLAKNQLTQIPPNLPASIRKLDASNNQLGNVSNMNWTSMTAVDLSRNNWLRTFSDVQLSRRLISFNIANSSNYLDIIIDQQTFNALDALKPWSALKDATGNDLTDPDGSIIYTGFLVTKSIRTSSATCKARRGKTHLLWAMTSKHYVEVCVAEPPEASSGASTGLIVGLVIGGLVILALVVLFVKRRQSKKTTTTTNPFAPPTPQKSSPQAPYEYVPPKDDDDHDLYPLHPSPFGSPATKPTPSFDATTDINRSDDAPSHPSRDPLLSQVNTSLTHGSSSHDASSIDQIAATSSNAEDDVYLDVRPLRNHKLELLDLVVTSETPWASGAFGEIGLGTYANEKVAIKRLKNPSPASVLHFIEEIKLHSRIESDFIVKFVGASWRRPIEMECVVEYMDLGDLRNYLATNSPAQFGWDQKLKSIMAAVCLQNDPASRPSSMQLASMLQRL